MLRKKEIAKHENGVRVSDLATQFGMAKSTICTILKNRETIKKADVARGVTVITKQRSQTIEEEVKNLCTKYCCESLNKQSSGVQERINPFYINSYAENSFGLGTTFRNELSSWTEVWLYSDRFEPSRSFGDRLTAYHWRVNTSFLELVTFRPVSGVKGSRMVTSFITFRSLIHSLYWESLDHFTSTVWDLRLSLLWSRDSNFTPAHLQSSGHRRLDLRSNHGSNNEHTHAVLYLNVAICRYHCYHCCMTCHPWPRSIHYYPPTQGRI